MKPKTLAELDKLHDKLFKEFAVLQQSVDALKVARRKSKQEKK
ncbi:MAG: hypothetical protein ABSH14_02195 [Verrucomicrobiia bacterium]|jgi:hypothetical protein